MTSTDDLFRNRAPTNKRKLEDPTQSFSRSSQKSAKLSDGSSPQTYRTNGSSSSSTSHIPSRSKDRRAFVEAEQADVPVRGPTEVIGDDNVDHNHDTEAGPALPPDFEDEEGDDEEGRFFGGGVSKTEREVLDYIDRNDNQGEGEAETEEKFDSAWLRRTAISFERKINKNAELRAKYESEPLKFVGSEADLDSEIEALSLLSQHPDLYAEFVKLGCAESLVGLLAHDNTDIAIAVCELLAELTDEDVDAEEEDWDKLVMALLKADLVQLLVSNLGRLDEAGNQNDREGIYHILNVLENVLSNPKNLDPVGKAEDLWKWLVRKIQTPDQEARDRVSQNRQYAAEILAILVQGSRSNRRRLVTANKRDSIDTILQLLSAYRKRDPERDSDEEEFAENLFDLLTCLVEDRVGNVQFLDNEGVELCLFMLRDGKFSKARALKVLDHACGGAAGAVQANAVASRIVEAAGLKTLFGLLMKSGTEGSEGKKNSSKNNSTSSLDRQSSEHLIAILSSMLRFLPADSAPRIRTLAKFVEKDYEKIVRLFDVRKEYTVRLDRVKKEIEAEKRTRRVGGDDQDDEELQEERELDYLSRRLDAGLFAMQMIDIILAWCAAEDGGARKKIAQLSSSPLSASSSSSSLTNGLAILSTSLRDQIDSIDPTNPEDGGGDDDAEDINNVESAAFVSEAEARANERKRRGDRGKDQAREHPTDKTAAALLPGERPVSAAETKEMLTALYECLA